MKLLSDGPDIHYLVRLDPDLVMAGLADAVGLEGLLFETSEKEFVGSVHRRTFRFRKNAGGRNAFRPYLHGRIEPVLQGSRVVVRLGLLKSTKHFMVLWLGIILLIGLVVLLLFLTGNLAVTPRGANPRTLLLAPPVMFAGGIALTWIGRLMGRGEESTLLEYADRTWGPRIDPREAE